MANELETSLIKPFLRVVSEVIGQIAGKTAQFELVGDQPNAESDAGVEVSLRSDSRVRMAVEFGASESQTLAKLLVGQPVSNDADRQATVEEIWRQITGRATTDLKAVLKGGDLDVVPRDPRAWNPALTFAAKIILEDEAPLHLVLKVSQEAAEYFSSALATQVPAAAFQSGSGRQQNLDLLLHVPLAVTLRFGERRMALREILQLNSGAVIELDRRTDEPVELFLDERVIARGNVVVVDGCYGLRVSEVCSPPPARNHTRA